MGSVKDLKILRTAYENKVGQANFVFSDRYSVFDWGKMPDQIKNKGRALAVMSAFNFEELEAIGFETHYRGLVTPGGELTRFDDLKEGGNGLDTMQVDMGVVHRHNPRIILGINEVPEIRYDYSFFQKNRGKLNNYLIPLEIIFRNGLPEGSSIFKRIEKAKKETDSNKMEKALKEIYDSLGIKSEPKPGDMLPEPVMNYTTKLEPGDRNLTETDAYRISGLNSNDFKEVGDVAFEVNNFVTKQAQKTGFVHYDGKVEMVWNNGPIVADVVGTFDEDRFGFKGEQVSKEFLRQWYKKNQPEFSKACDEWKEKGEDWQQRCPVKPRKLYPKLSKLVSQMYMAGCNKYVERNIFDVPDLEEVMEEIRPFR